MGGKFSREKPSEKDQQDFACSVMKVLTSKSRSELEKTYTFLSARTRIIQIHKYARVVSSLPGAAEGTMITIKSVVTSIREAVEAHIDLGRVQACSSSAPLSEAFRRACETIVLAIEFGRWGFQPDELSDIKYAAFGLVARFEVHFNDAELRKIVQEFTSPPWRITVDDALLLNASERVARAVSAANLEDMAIEHEQDWMCAEEPTAREKEIIIIEALSKRPEGVWAGHTDDTLRKILSAAMRTKHGADDAKWLVPEDRIARLPRKELVAELIRAKCACYLVEFTADEIASGSFPLEAQGCIDTTTRQSPLVAVLQQSAFGDGVLYYYRSALIKFITDVRIPTFNISTRQIKEICSKKRSQELQDLKKYIVARVEPVQREGWLPVRFDSFKGHSIAFISSFPGAHEAVIETVATTATHDAQVIAPVEAVAAGTDLVPPTLLPPSPNEEIIVTSENEVDGHVHTVATDTEIALAVTEESHVSPEPHSKGSRLVKPFAESTRPRRILDPILALPLGVPPPANRTAIRRSPVRGRGDGGRGGGGGRWELRRGRSGAGRGAPWQPRAQFQGRGRGRSPPRQRRSPVKPASRARASPRSPRARSPSPRTPVVRRRIASPRKIFIET